MPKSVMRVGTIILNNNCSGEEVQANLLRYLKLYWKSNFFKKKFHWEQ